MRERLCVFCQRLPITGRSRKYCIEHSRQASAILKRQYRRDWAANGEKYWQDAWKNRTEEARREYFRDYMRQYRRRKNRAPKPTAKQLRRAA